MPARSTTAPSSSPGQHAVLDREFVRRQMVDPHALDQGRNDLGEAAADHGQLVPQPFERPHQRAGAGGQDDALADGEHVVTPQAGQQSHPAPEGLLEVQLPRHGRGSHRRHLFATATPFGQEIDDLSLEQCGVGIQHDQVFGSPMESRDLHGDVDLTSGRLRGQVHGAAMPRSAPATVSS